ncbi:MAG: hypothetical protein Q8Q05_00080 [bacterium]|nr:hypothetical protein [bacterium]
MDNQRLGKVTKEILGYVLVGALCCIALSSPIGASKLTKVLWKETKKALSGYKANRLKRLQRAGYITTQGGRVLLTKQGKSLLARAQIDDLKIEKHQWDHLWRCVAYDIPDHMKILRKSFHRKLIKMGFVHIQKSVLVCPYRCSEQVLIASRFYEIEEYILFMEANDTPSTSRLKEKFSLSS